MCARVRSILGEGAGWLGAGRCHDSDDGRLGVRAEGRSRAARGAPNISSFTRAGRWLGSRAAEEQVGRRRLGRGAVRGLTTWARNAARLGSGRSKRRCGIARGRTSFAPTDGRPRGGEPAEGNEAAGGGPLADPTASPDTRAGWESALREDSEARDRSRTRLLHLARGPAPGWRCGQVCQRPGGLVPRRQAGDRSRTHCLARPAGRLGAGPAGGGGKGGWWSAHGLSPGNSKLAGGPLARGRSAGAAGSNSAAAARQWRAGRLGGRRAGGRAGADRGSGEGQGGRKVSGV